MNRSTTSIRSVGSVGRGGRGGGNGQRAQKEIKSLRLRLAGTHNAIRSLQEQLHERTAEVDELRAQLLSKTRALEAARSGSSGSDLNRSYISNASGHLSGKEAQAKRKYQLKLHAMEQECDDAIVEARKKEQRAIEINADLRTELERLRLIAKHDEKQLQERNEMIQDIQKALASEKIYSHSLLSGSGSGSSSQINDLTPNVTVRMLKLEIARLQSIISESLAVKVQQENQHVQATGRSLQLEKENSVLRNRVEAGSLRSAGSRTKQKRLPGRKFGSSVLNKTSGNRRSNASPRSSPSPESSSGKKRKGSLRSTRRKAGGGTTSSPGGIVESIATKATVEAQRYAKLKRMYDRTNQK